MIVVDASAALSALLVAGDARTAVGAADIHAPHLIDSEIASGLRRQVTLGRISAGEGWTALATWRRLGLRRHPSTGLFERVWDLRDNLSAYDAAYVALAEVLGCALLTGDRRLANAPGLRCSVTVVPS